MVAPVVVQHASATAVSTSGTTTALTPTFGSNTTAGTTLVACVTGITGTGYISSVTVTTNGTAENWASRINDLSSAFILTDPGTAGGQKIINVTVTWSSTQTTSNTAAALVDVYEVSGLGHTPYDQHTLVQGPGGVTTWTAGTTGTTTYANEIAFGCMTATPANYNTTSTVTGPAGPWVNATALSTSFQQGGTSTSYRVYAYQLSGYEILATTQTVTYSGTTSVNCTSQGVQVTLFGTGYPTTAAAATTVTATGAAAVTRTRNAHATGTITTMTGAAGMNSGQDTAALAVTVVDTAAVTLSDQIAAAPLWVTWQPTADAYDPATIGPTLITPPTLLNQLANNQTALTSTFTPTSGELIVVKVVAGDAGMTIALAVTGGLAATARALSSNTGFDRVELWTIPVPTSPGAVTVTVTFGAESYSHCAVIERWGGGTLAASPALSAAHGTSPSYPQATITTVSPNSVVSWVSSDWNGVSGASRVYSCTVTPAEESYQTYAGHNTFYFAYQYAPTVGAQLYGLTTPTGQAWQTTAIEIQLLTVTAAAVRSVTAARAATFGGSTKTASTITGTVTAAGHAAAKTTKTTAASTTAAVALAAVLTVTVPGTNAGGTRPTVAAAAAAVTPTRALTAAGTVTAARAAVLFDQPAGGPKSVTATAGTTVLTTATLTTAGSLIVAVASAPGVDSYGNPFDEGITLIGTPGSTNVLAVNAAASGQKVAGFDYAGNILGQTVTANTDLVVGGVSVSQYMYWLAPQGAVVQGWIPVGSFPYPATPVGGTETAIYEVDAALEAGRVYRVAVGHTRLQLTSPAGCATIRVRATLDGTTPTVSSAYLFTAEYPGAGATTLLSPAGEQTITPTANVTLRMLLTLQCTGAGTAQFTADGTTFDQQAAVTVYDEGPASGTANAWIPAAGGTGSGGTGSGGGGTSTTSLFYGTQTWSYGGGRVLNATNTTMVVGGNYYQTGGQGQQYAFINFAAVAATIPPTATINSATLRLLNLSTYYSSGMTVGLFACTVLNQFISYGDVAPDSWPVAEGAIVTHTLAPTVVPALIGGGCTYLVLAAPIFDDMDLGYYGHFWGGGAAGPNTPLLTVNWG